MAKHADIWGNAIEIEMKTKKHIVIVKKQPIINFLLSPHGTWDKEMLLGDMMKLGVYIY